MSHCIGLFGGTFDPPHNGHRAIAKSFLKSGVIDELWVLLTPYPPHKSEADQSVYAIRKEMVEAAFEDISRLRISTVENELPKPSYSYKTIQHLKKEFPDATFYFCMGEDSLSQFHTWKAYKKILEECDLLVAQRPGVSHSDTAPHILEQARFVNHIPLDISSTQVKERIKSGDSVQEMIPPKVLKIIEKEQIYI